MSLTPITQFETRDLRIRDELRLQVERRPLTRRSPGLRLRLMAIIAAGRRRPAALSE